MILVSQRKGSDDRATHCHSYGTSLDVCKLEPIDPGLQCSVYGVFVSVIVSPLLTECSEMIDRPSDQIKNEDFLF